MTKWCLKVWVFGINIVLTAKKLNGSLLVPNTNRFPSHHITLCVVPVWDGAVPERISVSDTFGPSVPHWGQGSEQDQRPRKQQDIHLHRPRHKLSAIQPVGKHLKIVSAWMSFAAMAMFDLWPLPQSFESEPHWSSWLTNLWETWCWKLNNHWVFVLSFEQYSADLVNTNKSSPTLLAERMANLRQRRQERRTMWVDWQPLLLVCLFREQITSKSNEFIFKQKILKYLFLLNHVFLHFFLGISVSQGWRSSTGSPQRSLWRAATWSIMPCRPCTSWETWVPLEGRKHTVHDVTPMF